MTRARSETNMHEALYKIACDYPTIPGTGVSGVKALAQIMGMSVNTLRNKLSPDIDTHKVSFEEASAIMELCHQAGMPDAFAPLEAMNWRHGFVAFPEVEFSETADDSIYRATAEVTQHFGEVVGAMNEAMQNNSIGPKELEKIESRFRRMTSRCFGWIARIRGRAKKDAEKRSILSKVCHPFQSKAAEKVSA